ncbi:ankyrin repeat domain-containing protein [Dactylosporangium sp. NPDC000244]|uniref:ankyrin repeat domain-containing protein n=1 Tax=Dactylosporangium sp. NPDC000244 TaxID=3154365 RepID=UPI00332852F0
MEDAGSNPADLPFLARELPLWRKIRAEMPPPALVAAAASARSAGDWRAAASLLPVTIDVDLAAVRARFGTASADRLEDDLRHLCLDLLWWHLPRHRGGRSTLQAQVSAVLAPRSGAATEPLVRLRLPKSPAGPQRVHLSVTTLADLEHERWYYAPRPTWDVREASSLARLWDAPPVFALLESGDYREAWQQCGITLDFDDLSCLQSPSMSPTSPVGVAELATEAGAAFGVDQVATLLGAYVTINLPSLRAEASDPSDYLEVPVRIPTSSVPPDLALIAAGLLSPDALHPLMLPAASRAGFASPGADSDDAAAATAVATAAAAAATTATAAAPHTAAAATPTSAIPPTSAAATATATGAATAADAATKSPTLRDRTFRTFTPTGDMSGAPGFARQDPRLGSRLGSWASGELTRGDHATFRVRCGGDWHRLGIAGGALTLHDHDEQEQMRESALRALGGDSHGCFGVEQAWQQGGGRLPRALHEHRRALMHRLQFGDTEHLLRGLGDGTVDPRMRAHNGWSLMHMAIWLDHERVLPVLLDAGVPVDGADRIGRTPLYEAVMQGGDPAFVRDLLAAGADPKAETVHGTTPAHVARYYHAGRDLEFLASL